RRRLAVGQNAADAHARRLAKEAELNARNHGVAIVATEPNGHRRSLTAAVTDFLEEKRLGKKHRTHTAYTVALGYFLESCKKRHLEDIERRDLLHFSAFLRDEKVLNPRTCWNKFCLVITFLRAYGIRSVCPERRLAFIRQGRARSLRTRGTGQALCRL